MAEARTDELKAQNYSAMLNGASVINSVIRSLHSIKVKKIILDPVMVAKGGAKLIDDNDIALIDS